MRKASPAQLLAPGGALARSRNTGSNRSGSKPAHHAAARSLTPEPEVSFGRDFDAGSYKPTSRRSGSSCTSNDLTEVHSDIQRALRSVLGQISPANPTLHTGSYASNMGLKRLKEKLEALDRLNKVLEDRSVAVAAAEQQVEMRLEAVRQRELQLEAGSGGSSQRVRELEVELTEAKALLVLYRQESVSPQASPDPVRRRLTFDSLQSDELRFDTDRSLTELRATAELLERKTLDLIQAQKEIEARVRSTQSRELDDRFLSILAEEESITDRRGELEAKDSELQREAALLHGKKRDYESFLARESKTVVAKDLVLDLVQVALVTVAEKHAAAAAEKKGEVESLIEALSEDVETARTCKENLLTQVRGAVELSSDLQKQRNALNEAEAKVTEELSLLKEGKADILIRRRDEIIHKKEAAFNEKLQRFQEREARVKAKEQELALREAKLLTGEVLPVSPADTDIRPESPISVAEKEPRKAATTRQEKELKSLQAALKRRSQVLSEQEEALKKTAAALELQQAKVKRAWDAAQLKMEQAKNLESRLEATKAEIAARQSDLDRRQSELEALAKPSEGKAGPDVQRLRAELRGKIEELRSAQERRSEVEGRAKGLEDALEEKEKETAALRGRLADARKAIQRSSKRQLDDGLSQSPTSNDFAQVFRARQQTMLENLDAADREKREMSQTLHDFLSDLH